MALSSRAERRQLRRRNTENRCRFSPTAPKPRDRPSDFVCEHFFSIPSSSRCVLFVWGGKRDESFQNARTTDSRTGSFLSFRRHAEKGVFDLALKDAAALSHEVRTRGTQPQARASACVCPLRILSLLLGLTGVAGMQTRHTRLLALRLLPRPFPSPLTLSISSHSRPRPLEAHTLRTFRATPTHPQAARAHAGASGP